MATRPLTLLMTGGNTGLGLSALQSLLSSPSPHYRIIIGSRSPASATSACASLRAQCPEAPHDVLWLPLDLAERGSVEEFVRGVEEEVGEDGIDCVVLNAAVFKPTLVLQDGGWCEEVLVNHFGEFWASTKGGEANFVQRNIDYSTCSLPSSPPPLRSLESSLSPPQRSPPSLLSVRRPIFFLARTHSFIAASLRPLFRGEEPIPENAAMARYSASKFVQMVAAHGWRMTLQGRAEVLAVSPGAFSLSSSIAVRRLRQRQGSCRLLASHATRTGFCD